MGMHARMHVLLSSLRHCTRIDDTWCTLNFTCSGMYMFAMLWSDHRQQNWDGGRGEGKCSKANSPSFYCSYTRQGLLQWNAALVLVHNAVLELTDLLLDSRSNCLYEHVTFKPVEVWSKFSRALHAILPPQMESGSYASADRPSPDFGNTTSTVGSHWTFHGTFEFLIHQWGKSILRQWWFHNHSHFSDPKSKCTFQVYVKVCPARSHAICCKLTSEWNPSVWISVSFGHLSCVNIEVRLT